MDNNQESKKCFCARCFLPIDAEDKVDIDDQNFHRICSMCCICRSIPKSLKMFYGHVFCNDCFKTHVMNRFRGDSAQVQSNSWWMQWGPGVNHTENPERKEDEKPSSNSSEPPKRFICARCLQPVDEHHRVTIGDQSFHTHCGQCCICHKVPTNNVKIYYGQVFCEECFHRHVWNRNKDNPSEFFKNCFDHWQNNVQFAENMKEFMGSNKDSSPFIFMMNGQQPPFCRCGTGPQEWFPPNEPKKSATHAINTIEEESCEESIQRSFESRESIIEESDYSSLAAEKIEKLTKYLHEIDGTEGFDLTWNLVNRELSLVSDSFQGWTDMQDRRTSQSSKCPKCLWQSGPIFVPSEYLQKVVSREN